jgi:hypothetical protein
MRPESEAEPISPAFAEFSRDYHALTRDDGDDAAFNVFTRSQQADVVTMRHFWGGEMNGA